MEENKVKANVKHITVKHITDHPIFTDSSVTPFFNAIYETTEDNGVLMYLDMVNEPSELLANNIGEMASNESMLSLKLFSKHVELGEIVAAKDDNHTGIISEIARKAIQLSYSLGEKHSEKHPEIANAKIDLDLPKPVVEVEPRPSFSKSPIDWFMSFFRPRKEIHRVVEYTSEEKASILRRKIITKLFHVSNIIAVNSRRGPANKAIVSVSMGAVLSDTAAFQFVDQSESVIPVNPLSIYKIGSIAGIEIYVDPYKKFNDTSILIYRCESYDNRQSEIDPGLKLIYKENSIEDVLDPNGPTEKVKATIVETGFACENKYFLLRLDFDILQLL